ncbi:DUF6090 family protein [Winogradskyella vincentii]|uniref:Uncharacterized protein n=1 Tax=Winogradskyella vincentii TaxID=2877122 RepID=A0ABS7Y6M6_9FLAO|nr:DUF6090 family protein [Winogradskyella vincentii]MCA0154277.1 hypothetical protein [Winogradskyella vincentii]
MIKFFRKIRQRLLSEGETRKYFKYAIGEIFLVVIGILLALQINNLNENRKNKLQEEKYLKGILENINDDISELNSLLERDTLRLNNYTLLQKALVDENIRSDGTLMGQAIWATWEVLRFDGNRVLFDDMMSSGKINLIQSDALKHGIQQYYNTCKKMIDAANTNMLDFQLYKRKAFGTNIDMSARLEAMNPPQWNGALNETHNSFFNKDGNDDEVKEFVYNLSAMKTLVKSSATKRQSLIKQARQLIKDTKEYLGIQIESNSKDESTSVLKKGAFIPSSPENKMPISDEELKAYEGKYQFVKKSKSAYLPAESIQLNMIYIHNNHLVAHTLPLGNRTSYYLVAPDEFKYSRSFLFNDDSDTASLLFGRNNENQVDGLTFKGWGGTYEFKKIK